MKKMIYGLLVAAVAVGVSAFTTKHLTQSSIYRYYNTAGTSDPTDRSQYEYHADPDLCEAIPANVCSEEWDFGQTVPEPAEGSNPPLSATLVPNTEMDGTFNP